MDEEENKQIISSSWIFANGRFKYLQHAYMKADSTKPSVYNERFIELESFYRLREKYTIVPKDIEQLNYQNKLQKLFNHLTSVVLIDLPTKQHINNNLKSLENSVECLLDAGVREQNFDIDSYILPCLEYSWFIPWLPFYYSDI